MKSKTKHTGTRKVVTDGVVKQVSKTISHPGVGGIVLTAGVLPVADKIDTGMRHTALTADGKGVRDAHKHLPKGVKC